MILLNIAFRCSKSFYCSSSLMIRRYSASWQTKSLHKIGLTSSVNSFQLTNILSLKFERRIADKIIFDGVRKFHNDADATAIHKDALLYRYNRPTLHKYVILAGLGFSMYFFYKASYAWFGPITIIKTEDGVPLDSNRERHAISLVRLLAASLYLVIGWFLLALSVLTPIRTVHTLTLLKGGSSARITTYSPLGRITTNTYPVLKISCPKSRSQSDEIVKVKVRGHMLAHDLKKKKGEFVNVELFDKFICVDRRF